MLRNDLAKRLDDIFHHDLQLSYDNAGYNVALTGEVSGIYVTLDATVDAIDRAVENGCNFLLTHHPIIFRPLPNIDDGHVSEVIVEAIRRDVAIYSAHTNVDVMLGGLNDEICRMLGMSEVEVLDAVEGGRIGRVEETTVRDLARVVKSVLRDNHIKTVCGDKRISRLLVVNGAGGGDATSIRNAIDRGVDCIVTAEVKYNLALEMKCRDVGLIEVGHYESEWAYVPLVERTLRNELKNIKIVTDEGYRTPYDEEHI